MTNAGVGYVGTPVAGKPRKEARFESGSVTDGEWFFRFALGMRWRMGEKKFQNKALTPEMVVGLSDMLDEAWRSSRSEKNKESLEELMCYVLIGYGASLRGEEVPLTSMKGMLFFWEETQASTEPYIMIPLFGRFKGETGYRWHCLPISDRSRSGIPHRLWLARLMSRRVDIQGRRNGWFLQQGRGRKARISDYA